jgi:hypothetical protein
MKQTEDVSVKGRQKTHVTKESGGMTPITFGSSTHDRELLEMDPISATASIAGLLAIATTLVESIYAFSLSAKDFRNEWTSIANEVAQLLGLLTALKPSFGIIGSGDSSPPSTTGSIPSSKSTPSEKEYDILTVGRTQQYLAIQLVNEMITCQSTLMDVERLLSQSQLKPGQRISNVKNQLLWPLRKPEFQKLMERLETHKSTFILILSSQGTYALTII